MKNIWLLDIDGVINALSKKPPSYGWENWLEFEMLSFPITTAAEVVDFISEVHEGGLAEVVWCTTWQVQANLLGKKLGLPHLRWIDKHKIPGAKRVWWKGKAVELLLDAGGYRIVWTDDDIDFFNNGRNLFHEDLLKICPNGYEGLMPKHIEKIRKFLSEDVSANASG